MKQYVYSKSNEVYSANLQELMQSEFIRTNFMGLTDCLRVSKKGKWKEKSKSEDIDSHLEQPFKGHLMITNNNNQHLDNFSKKG